MQRVTTSTKKVDLFGAGKDGYTDGSPGVEAATTLDSAALNAIQEELANAIEVFGGLTLDPAKRDQLSTVLSSERARAGRERLVCAAADLRMLSPGADVYRCVGFRQDGNTPVMAVGGLTGFLRTSSDSGASWIDRATGFGAAIRAICRIQGGFAFGGDTGEIQTSNASGSTWTHRTHPTFTGSYIGLASNELGVVVAIGTGPSTIHRSVNNGVAWSNVAIPAVGFVPASIDYSAALGLFVMSASDSHAIYTSVDGSSWTAATPGSSVASKYVDAKWCTALGAFIALAANSISGATFLESSPDGVTFTTITNPSVGFAANAQCIVATRHGVLVFCDGAIFALFDAAGPHVELGTLGMPSTLYLSPTSVSACEDTNAAINRTTTLLIPSSTSGTVYRGPTQVVI